MEMQINVNTKIIYMDSAVPVMRAIENVRSDASSSSDAIYGEMEKLHILTMYFMMERNRAFHLAEVQASHIIIMRTMEPMLPEKTQIR